MSRTRLLAIGFGVALASMTTATGAAAQAIRNTAGFALTDLPANDDGSTGLVNMGFNINFFGQGYTQLYVNNNGNVTFTGPLSTFTPFQITGGSMPIIAPFFADVDTRGFGSDLTRYGQGTVDGRDAFMVDWDGVGYYNQHTDKLNFFQLVMINRDDIADGDFDFEFNYGSMQWETGDASSGSGGLGGNSARAGWSNGAGEFHELAGSGVDGALIDGGAQALNGERHLFQVRNGRVLPPPTTVPEPATMVLFATGLVGIAAVARRRKTAKA